MSDLFQTADKGSVPFIKLKLCVVIILVGFALAACDRNYSDKEVREALHIRDNQTNEVWVGGVHFRIPAEYKIENIDIHQDKMRAGKYKDVLNQVWFSTHGSTWIDPSLSNSASSGIYAVAIKDGGFEPPDALQIFLNRPWVKTRDIPEWALREYLSKNYTDASWGDIAFLALDMKTPKGGPIVYFCLDERLHKGDDNFNLGRCRLAYQLPEGPRVEYGMNYKLMPRWEEVHKKIVDTINSFIVHE